jgi:hypothetical protein
MSATCPSTDLILALGLFGDLREETRVRTFVAVLCETLRVLRVGGLAIVGNSCVRQPAEQFIVISQEAGFQFVECTQPSRTVHLYGGEHPETRYLVVLRKQ